MAKQTITRIISDLSGEVLEEGQGETIAFGFGKKSFTIDLTQAEADEFRKLIGKYTSVAAQEVDSLPKARSSAKSDKERLSAIRAWAAENNIDVSPRGRISQSVQDQYDAAH